MLLRDDPANHPDEATRPFQEGQGVGVGAVTSGGDLAKYSLMAPNRNADADLLLGDSDAFAAFYGAYEDQVLGYFLRRTGRAELAADLTAETFARCLESRRGYDPERGEVRRWLFGIARHLLASSWEQQRVENSTRRALGMERLVVDDAALGRINELAEEPALGALGALPPDQQEAVEGRVLHELDYSELAQRLACSEGLVRQRVSRGLRKLKARLENSP